MDDGKRKSKGADGKRKSKGAGGLISLGDGKRERNSPGEGGGAVASADKTKPSAGYRGLEGLHQMGIVSGDGEAGVADADARMEGGNPNQGGITGGGADGGRDLSIYLVACHSDWSRISKPYIVYKMDIAPAGVYSPSPVISKRLKRGIRLECDAGGKTFISVRSARRAWIVGVGGRDTVIFDTETQKVIRGPDLKSRKSCPVLTAVGDKVYALSRCPSWKGKADPDFPPWFEVLDLKESKVVAHEGRDHLEGCSWKSLLIPPCLPWKLTPLEYTMLPITIARSYVVVNSYILVSFNQPWGTHAFDTNLDKWQKVDNNELPFVGCASNLFGSIFLGLSQRKGAINAYCINVKASDKNHALELSIDVLPVKYEGQELDEEPCFSSLEHGCFCLPSFFPDTSSAIVHSNTGESILRKARVYLRTYEIENRSLLEVSEESLQVMKPVIAFSSQGEQAFTVSNLHHGFSSHPFTFLSI
ncbi:hypothetical protein HU200_017660 [Digitaria exilis]|uniref:Uncharacterized protein n=1 Tax=Digitaria exilis TaxID=1010633 RepID=A0A835KJZ1_9POAL|nr:hypothetical protein HU200_017660 [Digitaria exilis]